MAGAVQQGVGVTGGKTLVQQMQPKVGMGREQISLQALNKGLHLGRLGARGSIRVQRMADDQNLHLVPAEKARNGFDIGAKAGAVEGKERLRGQTQRVRDGQADAAVADVQRESAGMSHERVRFSCASTVSCLGSAVYLASSACSAPGLSYNGVLTPRSPAVARTASKEARMEDIKKALEEQIRALEYELTTELPAEIKKAVALGDLSENAEYHMAKQRQVFVNARLGQLKKRMGELAMVNLENIPRNKVGFGSTVVVFDSTKDEEFTYKLVTSEESDVAKGLISTTSPIGRALLGKEVGDTATVVTPNGKRELEILKLSTIHDSIQVEESNDSARSGESNG